MRVIPEIGPILCLDKLYIGGLNHRKHLLCIDWVLATYSMQSWCFLLDFIFLQFPQKLYPDSLSASCQRFTFTLIVVLTSLLTPSRPLKCTVMGML